MIDWELAIISGLIGAAITCLVIAIYQASFNGVRIDRQEYRRDIRDINRRLEHIVSLKQTEYIDDSRRIYVFENKVDEMNKKLDRLNKASKKGAKKQCKNSENG